MGRAGFTLFEVLVALAVIALMTGVVLAARPTPSPELRLNATSSALIEEATRLRHRAVTTGVDAKWQPDARICGEKIAVVTFYADGTADAAEFCLLEEGRELRIEMNVLAGRLIEVAS